MRSPFVLAAVFVLSACAPEAKPRIEVVNGWARPALAVGHSSAAYMTVRNRGGGSDRLIGVAAEVAGRASLHRSANDGGIATMRPIVGGLEIAAGETVQFAPGGNHLMLEKVTRPLVAGDRVRLMLRFERSGDQTVEVVVGHAASDSAHVGH